ncbi:MAG: HEAT repeat domain-containing protein [Negativicutes bacterium]|nr:HEAT repeat domain-containing protein [Negativicutes bacterium]
MLLDSYKDQVGRLIEAIVDEQPLPKIKKNSWSRRAFLMIATEKMPGLEPKQKKILQTVLIEQGVVNYLLGTLSSFFVRSQLRACYYLGNLQILQAARPLEKAILSRNFDVSQAALVALAKIGRDVDVTVDPLKVLNNRRFTIERRADFVSEIMASSPEKLFDLVQEPHDVQVKLATLVALGKMNYQPAFPLFVELLKHPESEVRIKSAKGLFGSDYREAIPALTQQLNEDDDWVVKVACARTLGSLQASESAAALIHALRHSHWWVRTAAADALQMMGDSVIEMIQEQMEVETDRFALDRMSEIVYNQRIYEAGGAESGRLDSESVVGEFAKEPGYSV